MSNDSSSQDKLAPATFEALSHKLEAFKAECDESERPFVDALLHMLSDPIEQMRLRAPAEAYFTEEEEEILRAMEGSDQR